MSFGLSFSNVCRRPEFVTSMSCDSVYCMGGVAFVLQWRYVIHGQLINGANAVFKAPQHLQCGWAADLARGRECTQ